MGRSICILRWAGAVAAALLLAHAGNNWTKPGGDLSATGWRRAVALSAGGNLVTGTVIAVTSTT